MQVTDILRQQAKGICYGIIYGMGSKSLSEQLQLTEVDAFSLINTFKNTYPDIQTFITRTLKNCRDKGYVETLKGRRRYLPLINDNDMTKRGLYFFCCSLTTCCSNKKLIKF